MRFRTLPILLTLCCLSQVGSADEPNSKPPSITGQITDPDGKPLSGVRIDISTAAPKVGRGIFCPSCYRDCGKWARTDNDGIFRLEKLDPALRFRLVVASPGKKTHQTELIDPSAGMVRIELQPLPDNIDPRRIVSGIVTTEQGTPVVGAYVEPHGAKTSQKRWWGLVPVEPTVTDEKGHFNMFVPDDILGLDIEITGDGFCGRQIDLLEPGAVPSEIEVKEGARVTGILVDRGKPAANTTIAVVQTNRSVDNGIFIKAVACVTDENGAFEFRHLPPDQQYCIYSVAGDARQTRETHVLKAKVFKVPASGQVRDVGYLEVSDPIAVRGRVETVDGKPLPENLTLSFDRDPAWDLIGVPVAADGSFEASGLPPETYTIRLGSRDLVLATDKIKYQSLDESSFGIHVTSSVDGLVIPVKGK